MTPTADPLDGPAADYVRLALAVGRHDRNYVDAYHGPAAWRQEAESGEPVPLARLQARAVALSERLGEGPVSERRRFLRAQITAATAFVRGLAGERRTLSEEARLLYDLEPPSVGEAVFAAARECLDSALPGRGDLAARVARFRASFVVPAERVGDVVEAALAETRRRTRALVDLPEGEAFEVGYVRDRPWGAYNWYQGGYRSRIEVNTDLPIELAPILRTIAHEGYPGHHTYNLLLEREMVRRRGWPEYGIHPLFSPQSLLSEGTANAGVTVVFSADEEWRFLEEELAPRAGCRDADFARYRTVLDALEPLSYVRGEAARLLLDREAPEGEVLAFLMTQGLQSRERARKAVQFIRTYRSYVFNYTGGLDLVRAYLSNGGDFFDLLQRPATPGGLATDLGRVPRSWERPPRS